jgi:hypothetical protein
MSITGILLLNLTSLRKKVIVKVIEGTREQYVPEYWRDCANWPLRGPVSAVGTRRWSSTHANSSNTPKSDKYQGVYYDLVILDELKS